MDGGGSREDDIQDPRTTTQNRLKEAIRATETCSDGSWAVKICVSSDQRGTIDFMKNKGKVYKATKIWSVPLGQRWMAPQGHLLA